MEIKKVLVTGPTGAVGTALIDECLRRGILVTAICREGSTRLGNLPTDSKLQIIQCNLDHLMTVENMISKDYDVFYHFGWEGTFGSSRQDIPLQESNIRYSVDACKLAKISGCKVFIGAGSQSECGHIDGIIHPDSPCNPDNGYGISKLCAGNLTRILCHQEGIRHEWCRIVSLYGPHDASYSLISSLIASFKKGERIKTTEGSQIWDYIYSRDAARAFLLVAEKGKADSIYCFGSGHSRKLKDYMIAVRDIVNPKCEIGFGEIPYYPNQAMHLEADISNLRSDTGFEPKYSFEEGIKEILTLSAKDSI
jgi:UDP-glucose 4-epimerase